MILSRGVFLQADGRSMGDEGAPASIAILQAGACVTVFIGLFIHSLSPEITMEYLIKHVLLCEPRTGRRWDQ